MYAAMRAGQAMTPLELPKSSVAVVIASVAALLAALVVVALHAAWHPLLALAAFLLSGFLADFFTAVAHFGFDYVFPEKLPILGPIAREFREHHECPTLDPSNYAENFTKGGYCSLPLSIVVIVSATMDDGGNLAFFALSVVFWTSVWAFFFHQIHSYAHMGARLAPEEFNARVREISELPSKKDQVREFEKLFSAVPIPGFVRCLQNARIILNPKRHNIHHISFETDFSSVNGWSDPIANIFLKPLARKHKAALAEAPRKA